MLDRLVSITELDLSHTLVPKDIAEPTNAGALMDVPARKDIAEPTNAGALMDVPARKDIAEPRYTLGPLVAAHLPGPVDIARPVGE